MLSLEQKYHLYENSVQCHSADIDFINEQYQKIHGKKPLVLREDFGGTGYSLVHGLLNHLITRLTELIWILSQ